MSDLYQDLKGEFQDADYRYAYAESFLNTKIATQIKTLREQRVKTQVEIAARMGIKQSGYGRFEDVNHSVWKTDTLWNVARALEVRLNISFETFGSLLEEKKNFNKLALERPSFEDDPAFNVSELKHPDRAAAAKVGAGAEREAQRVLAQVPSDQPRYAELLNRQRKPPQPGAVPAGAAQAAMARFA